MILLVYLEMLIEVVDSLSKQGDLYFRRTGIGLVGAVLAYGCGLFEHKVSESLVYSLGLELANRYRGSCTRACPS